MNFTQAILLAIVQGITELFPVSSLGHAVLVPHLFKWDMASKEDILPFLTFLHFGTLFALGGLYFKDWLKIAKGIFSPGKARTYSFNIIIALIAATLPAVVIGGTLEHKIRLFFLHPQYVGGFLILNGIALILSHSIYKAFKHHDVAPHAEELEVSAKQAFIIGVWQALALFPGLSRSGMSIIGGLTQKLTYQRASYFSLLLAQPIILAATCKELWELRHYTKAQIYPLIGQSLVGSVVAAVCAWLCSVALLKVTAHKGPAMFRIFGIYCICFGLAGIFLI